MSSNQLVEHLTMILQAASATIRTLDNYGGLPGEGKLRVELNSLEQGKCQLVFYQGSVRLLRVPAECSVVACWGPDDLVELFMTHIATINTNLAQARHDWLEEEILPLLQQKIQAQLPPSMYVHLEFELADLGWFPEHHSLQPAEYERPYPNYGLVVRWKDDYDYEWSQSLDLGDPLTCFDAAGLAATIISEAPLEGDSA